ERWCRRGRAPASGRWRAGGAVWGGRGKGGRVAASGMDPGSAAPTSVVLQAASENPQASLLGLPKGVRVPILSAAEQQNLGRRMHFVSAASGYDLGVPKAIGPYWKGDFVVHLEFQPLHAPTPADQKWLAILKQSAAKQYPRHTLSPDGSPPRRPSARPRLDTPAPPPCR
ncbi:ABC transporter substrate-binding protein, partial [Burkholderia thailandensis]|uniref:ABC transporter substrate-binding protein n=1 Tax=Burkholderia thailandensis TaxID=57975 RepID=UPI0035C73893